MTNFRAKPTSIKEIRGVAKAFRQKCGLSQIQKFPACETFEYLLDKIFEKFEWEIIPDDQMSEEGKTFAGAHKIEIRESVYIAACRGDGRARFTIMHEVGHFLLHSPDRIALCRLKPGEKLPPFEDPEWQANTFAAEILMDIDVVHGMDYRQISKTCEVSFGAAKTRFHKLNKEEHGNQRRNHV